MLIFYLIVVTDLITIMASYKAEFETYLINAIKKRSIIYDRSGPKVKYPPTILKAWTEVAEEVRRHIKGVEVQHCQKRWKTLRDAFVKQLRKPPGSKAGLYTQQLSFLRPYVGRTKVHPQFEYEEYAEYDKPEQDVTEIKNEAPDYSEMEKDIDNTAMTMETEQCFIVKDLESDTMTQEPGIYTTADNKAKRKRRKLSDDAVHYSTSTNKSVTSPKKESLNTMMRSLNTLLQNEIIQQSKVNDPNEAYLTVLDGFLLNLPAEEQDKLKVEILNLVFNKMKAATQENRTN